MFFEVNSGNRHAVRKLLTAAGMSSSEVRMLANGKLGKALFDHVQSGKIAMNNAVSACAATATIVETIEDVTGSSTAAAIPQAVVQAVAPDKAKALEALLGLLSQPTTPPITEVQVRAMVDKELSNLKHRPYVIEIRSDTKPTVKIEGELLHPLFETVLKAVSTRVQGRRLHVWLSGPSGSGKSYLGHQVAKHAGLKYYTTGAIQSKYDLTGFIPASGDITAPSLRTPLREAVEFGGLFCWDDVDRSSAQALCAFDELLANGRMAFPDKVVEAHEDFVCVVTANTWGTGATADYVGATKMDQAFLNRFGARLTCAYDEALERDMVGPNGKEWASFVQSLRKAVVKEGIKVLITPRHTLSGCALLAAGISRKEVEHMTVFAGLDADTVKKLRVAAAE